MVPNCSRCTRTAQGSESNVKPDPGDPADESLAQWAARRAKRLRRAGERKVITLAPGPQRADAPQVHRRGLELMMEAGLGQPPVA
ncbi:DUF6087 family protein [Streptomyces sp. NPDC020799]|uniref:DUF6087 family protein n=1 Tax=Streptomyces sp. NPDC020799 TaxID=3365091 RepID=UPI0037A8B500